MDAAVRIEGLTRHFGDLCAVDHLTLTVNAGEIYGLLGVAGTLTLMYYRSRAQDAPQVLDPFIADKTNKEALLEPKVLMGRLDRLERNLSTLIAQSSSQSSSIQADSAEPLFKRFLTAEMVACCATSLTVGVAAGLLLRG